jgi:glutamate/tyrosine decarboxylase-like PLP-dependent enzyme
MDREARNQPELEALTQGLSITTFRYVPLEVDRNDPGQADYLNRLNEEILDRIQKSGEGFLSNAVVDGKFAMRACIVNFRTTLEDIEALVKLVVRLGREANDKKWRE